VAPLSQFCGIVLGPTQMLKDGIKAYSRFVRQPLSDQSDPASNVQSSEWTKCVEGHVLDKYGLKKWSIKINIWKFI
jgi:hypothetical protein